MITIRKAILDDLEYFKKAWNGFEEHHDTLLDNSGLCLEYAETITNSDMLFVKKVKELIKKDKDMVCVAVDEQNQIIGYAIGTTKTISPVFKIKEFGVVSDFYVNPDFRQKGICSLLKEALFNWFRKKGLKDVMISFRTNNHVAHQIYNHWGFEDYVIEARARL